MEADLSVVDKRSSKELAGANSQVGELHPEMQLFVVVVLGHKSPRYSRATMFAGRVCVGG